MWGGQWSAGRGSGEGGQVWSGCAQAVTLQSVTSRGHTRLRWMSDMAARPIDHPHHRHHQAPSCAIPPLNTCAMQITRSAVRFSAQFGRSARPAGRCVIGGAMGGRVGAAFERSSPHHPTLYRQLRTVIYCQPLKANLIARRGECRVGE